MADGIAGEAYAVGREETLHAFIGHADAAGAFGQQLVGDAGIGVLFLQQRGDSYFLGHVESGSAGISAHAYGHGGPEVGDNAAGEPAALEKFEEYGEILPPLLPVEAGHGQTFDVVACGGDALHFHASFGTDKKYLCIRAFGAYGVGNGNGGKDVSACSAAADDDPKLLFHHVYTSC